MDCTISTANDKDHVYSTHDAVEGHVNLQFQRNTTIEQLSIKFLGQASVCLKDGQQNPTTAQYVQGEQTFLSMEQPIDAKYLPSNGIALGRRTYRLPFEFTIPETLVPHACNCFPMENEQADNDHLPLPPTFDSRRQSGSLLSGTHSNQGRIYYVVQVSFWIRFSDGTSRTIREEKKINVRPTSRTPNTMSAPEAGKGKPIISQPHFGDLDGKAGELQAYTYQPLILRSSPRSSTSTPNTSLSIPLTLVYQPSYPGERPPLVGKVSVNLLCTSSYSAVEHNASRTQSSNSAIQTSHTESKRLRSIDLTGLAWARHPQSVSPRACENSVAPYSTALRLPISICVDPKVDGAETLTPSFSTCSISHSYALELCISYRAAQHSRPRLGRQPHLSLRVPLRICCTDDRSVQKSGGCSGTFLPEDVVEDKMMESGGHIEELWLEPPAYHSVVG